MQRRAAAMYVLVFLVIAVGALVFINVVDGPSDALDEADYELSETDEITIDGITYQVSNIDTFSATFTYIIEDAERSTTIQGDDLVNISGEADYHVEIPDEEEPTEVTLTETYPEHDLDTVEHDGITYVVIDGEFIEETVYLEEEYGPRDQLHLTVGDTFEYYDDDHGVVVDVTVDAIGPNGFDISWIGPSENRIILPRNDVSTIGQTDFGVNFAGEDRLQLTSDLDAFNAHIDAHDTWDERYQGFWGIGVLGIIAALMIGGLSYLPRRR